MSQPVRHYRRRNPNCIQLAGMQDDKLCFAYPPDETLDRVVEFLRDRQAKPSSKAAPETAEESVVMPEATFICPALVALDMLMQQPPPELVQPAPTLGPLPGLLGMISPGGSGFGPIL